MIVSDHAIERYHERVKPALSLADAETELRRLLQHAEIRVDPPAWTSTESSARPGREAAAWAYLTDSIALPLDRGRNGHWYAITLLTAGELSPERREQRNARRTERRRRAAVRRQKRNRLNRKRPQLEEA